MEMDKTASHKRGQIDWMITLVPLGLILALCIVFFFAPEQSNAVLSQVRFFFAVHRRVQIWKYCSGRAQ